MATNTKERQVAIAAEAERLVAEHGIEKLDALPAEAVKAQRRVWAALLVAATGCHRETARIAVAKACRRLQHPDAGRG